MPGAIRRGADRTKDVTLGAMPIAITDDHQALAATVADFARKHDTRAAARALLEAKDEPVPSFWDEMASLGWLGLHVDEEHGGSGYGLPELVVVVEELAKALTPGPFVPTVAASAMIGAVGDDAARKQWLSALADGTAFGAVALGAAAELRDGVLRGAGGAVLGGRLAGVLVVVIDDDVAIVDLSAGGVTVDTPSNVDPTRRSSRVTFDDAPATVVPGRGADALAIARTILAADAVGVAAECTTLAAEYAKVREQFGRPIAMFQAVKHHCANMLVASEIATANVWDAARAAASGGEQFRLAAAAAATHAIPAAHLCANLNIQVHGGIGMTWEHDAHLYLRRAMALAAAVDDERAATDTTALFRAGVRRATALELPPEAEPIRTTVRSFLDELTAIGDEKARKDRLIDSGYAVAHWPKPWGREAPPIEQLVIEQEFETAGVQRPSLGITGWVILTIIQHGTEDQVKRWARPTIAGDIVWCQLFSEPDAGSDAAGVKTKATRVDGGWLVNGQKVWTTGAQHAAFGLATVRTDPDAPKHNGITTMVIDMSAKGVEIRPLRLTTGQAEFNEIFFSDVFVPDDDVVGPVNSGWTVARATLGNESVSIGGGQGAMSIPSNVLVSSHDANPDRLRGGDARLGRYIAIEHAIRQMNVRSIQRAVGGNEPGPEGAVTKLVSSENLHDAAAMLAELAGPDRAFTDGSGGMSAMINLLHRAMSIAGGTSEIKRNQIGERILGLPRDPLIS